MARDSTARLVPRNASVLVEGAMVRFLVRALIRLLALALLLIPVQLQVRVRVRVLVRVRVRVRVRMRLWQRHHHTWPPPLKCLGF